MKIVIRFLVIFLITFSFMGCFIKNPNKMQPNIYEYSFTDIQGNKASFRNFVGKKIMIVNVASECGYTPQYAQLEELYENFHSQLEIIAFPCNDFGHQEPGTKEAIVQFCQTTYGVKFTLADKISILENPDPIYQWLTQQSLNGVSDAEVKWNFNKFLIDEQGRWVRYLPSAVSPIDPDVISWIEEK